MHRRRTRFRRSRDRYQRWLSGAGLFAIFAALAGIRSVGPTVVPDANNLDQVSGERGFAHIEYLLGPEELPHPSSSPENELVRQRLIAKLLEYGMEYEEQAGDSETGRLVNVLARRPGRVTARPILLVTHYDSCLVGPGAGDAMSCVGGLLETIRWLGKAPIESEVWFLFTDGEERGLLGAKQFVEQNQGRFKKPPLVFNFDARGSTGPSFMFQTGKDNYAMVSTFGNRLAQPNFTNSLMSPVYDQLPNGTDFTIFREAGWNGLNFALVYGAERYHTPDDTTANLSRHSVQHFANNTRRIIETLDGLPTDRWEDFSASEPATYFDILGGPVVRYPQRFDVFLVVLMCLFWFVAVIRSRIKRGVQRIPVIFLFLGSACVIVGSGLAGYIMSWFLRMLEVLENGFPEGLLWLCGGILFVCGVCMFIIGNAFFSRCTIANSRLAVLSVYSLLTLWVFIEVPGAAFTLLWPTLVLGIVCIVDQDTYWLDYTAVGLISMLWAPLVILFCGALGPNAGIILGLLLGIAGLPTMVLMSVLKRDRGGAVDDLLRSERLAELDLDENVSDSETGRYAFLSPRILGV
jgi:hypothetical protein